MAAPRNWSEAEKVGLLFQIIERSGTIPWDDMVLPEGRTRKACQVMIDKEKQKVKKAREARGEDVSTPIKKRQATEDEGGTPKSKKAKSASKKKGKAVEEEDEATRDDSEAGEVGEAAVKAEPVDEDMEDNSSDF